MSWPATFPPSNSNHRLVGPQATCESVLTAMATCSWVHLACNAGAQGDVPDRSGFFLWDAVLTITDLAAQPTQRRDLAFLSASSTAVGSARNLDEAIHLAAAMQFLGYRHVIATMWDIQDRPAADVADTVYAMLTQDGGPDAARAAEALHHAIRSLREAQPSNPMLWAPYIHLGSLSHWPDDGHENPAGFQNSATGLDLGFYAARSYSLTRPPRERVGALSASGIGRRQGGRARGGWSWRLRWGRRPL